MTMITPSYLGETIEYSSLHACRSTLEDPTKVYVANFLDDTVSVIDAASDHVIATVPVQLNPIGFGQFIGAIPPSGGAAD